MKKIAVLTENFIELCGALDFIKHIIMSLSYVAQKSNFDVFVFIKTSIEYKHYTGLKRLLYKIRNKVCFKEGYCVSSFNKEFNGIKGIKFVYYDEKPIETILKELKFDFVLPHLRPEYYNMDTPSFGYLYDCQHKYFPEFFTQEEIRMRDECFAAMVNGPCIVNSIAAKNDLIKFFDAPPENIYSLPFTPKLNTLYLKNNQDKIKAYNLPKRYFMISNQFWIHKNHTTAFKAFAEFSKKYNDVELVCTGTMKEPRKPEYINELKSLIEELDITQKVKFLGLIPKTDQVEIMKGAVAMIQTTLFEGGPGGGSIWDAIALGIPSIVSDIPINLEIDYPNLVTFFATKNAEDLATKMNEIIQKPRKTFSQKELIKNSEENLQKLGSYLIEIINENIQKRQKKEL